MKFFLISLLLATVAPLLAQAPALEPQQDPKKPLYGYVNPQTGKWVVKPAYNLANPYEQGPDGKYRALVQKGAAQGYLSVDGKPLGAGIVFESIDPMMEGNNLLVTVKGKKGIINLDGVYQLKPEYTTITTDGTLGYVIDKGGKKGFISPAGAILIQPLYSDIDTKVPGYFLVKKGDKAGVLSTSGAIIIEPKEYTAITPFTGDLWKIVKGDKEGLYNMSKKAIEVKPEYKNVGMPVKFSTGMLYPVCKPNGKWGAIDTAGKEVVKCKNQEMVTLPALNAIMVRRNNVGQRLFFPEANNWLELDSYETTKKGPFNLTNIRIQKPVQDVPSYGLSFGEWVALKDSYPARERLYNSLPSRSLTIMTDADGNEVSQSADASMEELGNYYLVTGDDRTHAKLYSKDGHLVRNTKLRGEIQWTSDPGWVADSYGHMIYPDGTEYEYLPVGEQLSFRRTDSSQPWTRLVNDLPDPNQTFDEVLTNPDDDHSASVRKNGKWGIVTDGVTTLECKFPTPVRTLSEKFPNYYVVGEKGKIGVMDKNGNEIIPLTNDSVKASAREGCIVVYAPGSVGLYNNNSKSWILPVGKYKNWFYVNTDKGNYHMWVCDNNNMTGVVSPEGKEIIPPSKGTPWDDDNMTFYDDGYITVEKDGKTTYYNLNGTTFTPKARAWIDDLSCRHNYMDNGQKYFATWVDVHCENLKGHKMKLICQVYNANGKPHIGRGGDPLKQEKIWEVRYDDSVLDDHSFAVNNNFIDQPRYTTRNYYVKYTLIDMTTGKTLATAKQNFSLERN